MIFRTGFCILAAALATGCVNSSGSGVTSTSGASTTGSVGVGGAGTTSGDGAGGAGTTSGAGGGGGEPCGVQLAPAAFDLVIDGVAMMPQPFPYNSERTVEGQVLASDPGTVAINTCPPSSNCGTVPATLTVTAPDLPSVVVPPGAWVRLRYRTDITHGAFGQGMASLVLIENLPDWMGSLNPISTTSRVWFAASAQGDQGIAAPPSYLPYKAEEILCGSCWTGNETWRVTFPGVPSFDVPTGAQQAFDVTGPLAAHYVFHGLNGKHDCESNGAGSYWLLGS